MTFNIRRQAATKQSLKEPHKCLTSQFRSEVRRQEKVRECDIGMTLHTKGCARLQRSKSKGSQWKSECTAKSAAGYSVKAAPCFISHPSKTLPCCRLSLSVAYRCRHFLATDKNLRHSPSQSDIILSSCLYLSKGLPLVVQSFCFDRRTRRNQRFGGWHSMLYANLNLRNSEKSSVCMYPQYS